MDGEEQNSGSKERGLRPQSGILEETWRAWCSVSQVKPCYMVGEIIYATA